MSPAGTISYARQTGTLDLARSSLINFRRETHSAVLHQTQRTLPELS